MWSVQPRSPRRVVAVYAERAIAGARDRGRHAANVAPVLLAHVVVDLDDARVQRVLAVLARTGDPVVRAGLDVDVVRLVAAAEGRELHVAVVERASGLRPVSYTHLTLPT